MEKSLLKSSSAIDNDQLSTLVLKAENKVQVSDIPVEPVKSDYGDLDDYKEIFGEMENLTEGA